MKTKSAFLRFVAANPPHRSVALLLSFFLVSPGTTRAEQPPPALEVEEVPPIPDSITKALRSYRRPGGYSFGGWLGGRREMVILAGGAPVGQVYSVVTPNAPPNPLTNIRGRPVDAAPRPGTNEIVVASDLNGDERVQLALLDPKTKRIKSFTDPGSRNTSPRWSPQGNLLAYSSTRRNGTDEDIDLLDFTGSEPSRRTFLTLSGLSVPESWTADGKRLAVINTNTTEGTRLLLAGIDDGAPTVLLPSAAAPGVFGPATPRFTSDGQAVILSAMLNADFRSLARLDISSGKVEPLGEWGPHDVEWFDLADDGKTAVVQVNTDGLSLLYILDVESGRARRIEQLPPGIITDLTFRPASIEFAFNLQSPDRPSQVYSILPARGTLVPWTSYVEAPPPRSAALTPEFVRFPSFDGLQIPAFVYRPRPDSRWKGPRPVLIDIHGGPQAQARPSYLGEDAFWLDELGIALVYPNVRGSTGYGTRFAQLDDGRRRPDALRDLGALLDWIAEQPDLDSERVILRGASYGGYMVLAALAEFGDRLLGGIELSGISNFETFLQSKDPAVLDLIRREFGDERDASTRDFLRTISPVHRASSIRNPLLIIHGTQDTRVPVEEARQIASAVRANGVPVWTIFATNEGHVFSRPENSRFCFATQVFFVIEQLRSRKPTAGAGE